ncbi:hypothetical protein [Fontivita pretiosa]|uniref:hypothetical protein n=1 Tax=Fontivita pretiosa TaxID=2989684 RepID=UPI003D17D912
MSVLTAFSCCSDTLKVLSRAAAKAAAAKLRTMGIVRRIHPDWIRRAQLCERCHLRVIYRGQSYCGHPLLRQVRRDPTVDGCGCPTRAKAQAPNEHCPVDMANRPARRIGPSCTCKWCSSDH